MNSCKFVQAELRTRQVWQRCYIPCLQQKSLLDKYLLFSVFTIINVYTCTAALPSVGSTQCVSHPNKIENVAAKALDSTTILPLPCHNPGHVVAGFWKLP